MSSSNHHFLAILPLFAILSISPMHLDSKLATGRAIASEVVVAYPKYEARALKIDRTKIVIDKDLDPSCFSDRASALDKSVKELRQSYKYDIVEKEAVELQRIRLQSLVSSMVDLEEDMKVLKTKKAWDKVGEELADKSVAELKTTIESLLIDEVENDLAVLKDQVAKDEAAQVATTKPEVKPEVKPEAEKPAKEEPAKDPLLCELEEKNKVLTKQVQELLEQQKTIMQTMLGMSSMMVQMNQGQQGANQMLPPWMRDGSMMNPQTQYPYLPGQGQGQWVFYPQSVMPTVMMGQGQQAWEPNVQTTQPQQQPQLGQQAYQQQSLGQYNYLPQPQPYMAPSMNMAPGTFGSNPTSFNFGQSGDMVNFGV